MPVGTARTPAGSDSLQDAFPGQTVYDPTVPKPSGSQGVYGDTFFKPVQDEILALVQGRIASRLRGQSFTCAAGDAVGDPVYLSAASTVGKGDATTAAKSRIIGFIRHKGPLGAASVPAATTCYVENFLFKSGLTGGTSAQPVYLTDAGGFGASAGTVKKIMGMFVSATTALLCADEWTALALLAIFNDAEGNPADVTTASPADGTSEFAARRDHVHGLADNAVTDAKLRDSGACSVIARAENSAGSPADVSAGSNDQVLRRRSDVVGFGSIVNADVDAAANIAVSKLDTDVEFAVYVSVLRLMEGV